MQLIIFPHQLYTIPQLPYGTKEIFLIEHPYFFEHPNPRIKYHKQKLILHRASMRAYFDQLRKMGYPIKYIEFQYAKAGLKGLLSQAKVKCIAYFDPTDRYLDDEIKSVIAELNLSYERLPSSNFITPVGEIEKFFQKAKRFSFQKFYTWQRKRLNILVDEQQNPLGGKWTYESASRKKLPKDVSIPHLPELNNDHYINSAKKYINNLFPDNPGNDNSFIYPITHAQAEDWLYDFLEFRLEHFSTYQDAIEKNANFLFHSVLSPILNIGLLSPQEIVQAGLNFYESKRCSLPAIESFVRQFIGWREFTRAKYLLSPKAGSADHRQQYRSLPTQLWNLKCDLLPVDNTFQKVERSGYAHHTERLMVINNWMVLCELSPQTMYEYFMSMFVDAYDWAVAPHIFDQEDENPRISGSSYIRKISNYPGGAWTTIWDALFWRFVNKHREYFVKHKKLGVITSQLHKMPQNRLDEYNSIAESYLEKLFN